MLAFRQFSGLLRLAALVSVSCSSPAPSTKAKSKEPEKAEPVGALKAYYRMYQQARAWSTDIEALTMESLNLSTVPAAAGKYGAWRGTFVSQSKRAAKPFTYSVMAADGLFKDVFGGHDDPWSGPRGQNAPFPIQALKIDSDAAYTTAMKHGEEYSKKHPDSPITINIEKVKDFGNPVYRVIWGTSAASSGFSIYVDASTGEYLKTMR